MNSEELTREILDIKVKSRNQIDKNPNDTSTYEEIRQHFQQIEEAHKQFDKELEKRGIGWFIFTHGKESGEDVATKLVEFIEKETGIKIETAYVEHSFYVKVNRK